MNPQDYSPEQKKDIEERVEKAKIALKELNLQPAAFVSPSNVGNDVFAFKVVGFLQDLKYSNTVSPITKYELDKKDK